MKTLNQVEPRQLIDEIPFTISAPGAYYLAKNMYATSSIVGILVLSGDVQIDLNGFALIGSTDSLDGICIDGTNENITVRNGSVRKWGGFGINGQHANDGSVIEVKAHRNGRGGILVGEACMVERCAVFGNGYDAPPPPAYTANNPDQDVDDDGMPDDFEQMIIGFSAQDVIATLTDVWPHYDPELDDPPGTYSNIYWDFDGDTVDNGTEQMDRTDPTNPNDNSINNYTPEDTDFDGLDDGWEMIIIDNNTGDIIASLDDVWPWHDPVRDDPPGTYSNIHWDFDQDTYENMQEFQGGTDPTDPASVPTNTTQSHYTTYTEPPLDALYDPVLDPEDEPTDDGIRTGGFSTILECQARRNRGSGIYAEYASRIIGCVVAGNLVDGIRVTSYATVSGCTAARNMKDGITLDSKCRIVNNNCGQNGTLDTQPGTMPEGAGIRILGNGNRIENNNVSGNAIGIRVDNSFETYGAGAGANLIIGNSAVDNWGGAFDLSTGDFMGGEYYEGDVGDPTGVSNAMLNVNSPFSNFRF